MEKTRKKRSDAGKPKTGKGAKGMRTVVGGRPRGRTLLVKVMALDELSADFIRYEQQRREDSDPRETVKAILAEQALAWDAQRHARLDASLLIL